MKYLHHIVRDILGAQIHATEAKNFPVRGLCRHTRDVQEGFMYAAIPGNVNDGHNYIDEAINKKATSVLLERLPLRLHKGVCYVQVPCVALAWAHISSVYFDCPSQNLNIVGITGTNGKTTIATLLYRLFKALGYKVGLFSSLAYVSPQPKHTLSLIHI